MHVNIAIVASWLCVACLPIASRSTTLAEDHPQRPRARDLGLTVGQLQPGPLNAITDVAGVQVGHFTLRKPPRFNTGITAVLPHSGNVFLEKVPAAIEVGNGFGKLIGISQVNELGQLETPVLLTGTLNVPKVADGLISYMLSLPKMQSVRSINPIVGETNDGYLSDIRARPLGETEVRKAIESASTGAVPMGSVGAGTGTVCFNFKGGIGSASRTIVRSATSSPSASTAEAWTVGVLVQTNFGGPLRVAGLPSQVRGSALGNYLEEAAGEDSKKPSSPDGSLMIVVATDAPLSHRNLRRLAKRCLIGMGRTGGFGSNGSGDYVIAFSTHPELRIRTADKAVENRPRLSNNSMTQLFLAATEATEEAILDSLFTATTTVGFRGTVREIPVDKILELARKDRND